MGGGESEGAAFAPAVGEVGGEALAGADRLRRQLAAEGDGVAVGAEHERDGDFPPHLVEAECEIEGEACDGLGGIELAVGEHVAHRGPAGLARDAHVQAVAFEEAQFVGDRHRGTVVEWNEAETDGRTGVDDGRSDHV